jgi:glutathione peroxidase
VSIYDFAYTSIEGRPVKMSEYAGKVLFIVNTASKCGFKPQYEGLEELYQKYNGRAWSSLAFPATSLWIRNLGMSMRFLSSALCATV